MENNPESKPDIPQNEKKEKIAEADVMFDSLLKQQSSHDDSTLHKMKFMRLGALGFLAIIIVISLYLAVNFYTKTTDLGKTPTSTETTDDGTFNPQYYMNKDRKLEGKISKNLNSGNDRTTGFELLSEDGKNIAYLYSDNNDLNLSSNLKVEIHGQFVKRAQDGKDVILVESIKLK